MKFSPRASAVAWCGVVRRPGRVYRKLVRVVDSQPKHIYQELNFNEPDTVQSSLSCRLFLDRSPFFHPKFLYISFGDIVSVGRRGHVGLTVGSVSMWHLAKSRRGFNLIVSLSAKLISCVFFGMSNFFFVILARGPLILLFLYDIPPLFFMRPGLFERLRQLSALPAGT